MIHIQLNSVCVCVCVHARVCVYVCLCASYLQSLSEFTSFYLTFSEISSLILC